MFLSKVHNQKMELMRAVFRNMYLKEKSDYLDGECKMLAEQILSCQVTKEEKRELKLAVEKELNNLKELNDRKLQEYAIVREQMVSMSNVLKNTKSSIQNSINENESINDDLNSKNETIERLQEELVRLRLEAAEQWAFIMDLRQTKDELEREKELLTKTKPETISRLQEELIQARLLQTQYSVEFDKIRQELDFIKLELNKHTKKDNVKNNERQVEGNIKLTFKGVIWKSTKNKINTEANEVNEDIKKLEEEKMYLQSRIPDLQNKIEILNKHIQFKEAERSRLQEKLENIKIKCRSLENITSERSRQYDQLQNSASEKVCLIRSNTEEKIQNIDELSSKLDVISKRRVSYSDRVKMKESKTIQNLEDQILLLESKVRILKAETMQLYKKTYNSSSDNDKSS